MSDHFNEGYQKLNPAQRQAVDTIDGPVLVIAGPGTGKTQLLGMRVANILRKTDVNASNILCLTFTESGEKAIQRRLQELIGDAGNRVSVHTFHGFGRAVIATNPEAFYDAQETRAADDLTLFEILHDIFEHLPHNNPLASHTGQEYVFLKDAQARISQLKTAGITPDQLRQVIAADKIWCKQANSMIATTYQQFKRFDKKYLPLISQLAENLAGLARSTDDTSWLQPLAVYCLQELQEALQTASDTNSSTPVSQWKSRWIETVNGELALKAITQHNRLETLATMYEQYEAGLRERKLYDYDDMILEVLTALKSQPDLRASLQEQYQYLLIDEYQDTNPAQAQLLDMLADNPVHEERPNIMAVGDDDQTIYAFQGADSGVMLRFRQRWRNVTTIVLTDNYRSTQPILDTVRQLIMQGGGRLEDSYEDIVKQLQAQGAGARAKPELLHFKTEAAQHSWLTAELAKSYAGTTAVIAPRHKYLQRLVPYLAHAELQFHYERQTNVLEIDQTKQFLQVAKLIDALGHKQYGEAESLLPEVLSYSWWDIEPLDIWHLSLQSSNGESWLEQMSAGKSGLADLANWLKTTAEETLELELDASLELICSYVSDSIDSQQLNSHLSSIVYELTQYQPDKTAVLHDVVRYVSLCQQAKLAVAVKETTDGSPAIQLLTGHKAKGLEFDRVYLIDATDRIWKSEKGVINKLSLPANLGFIQPAGETADDRLRVLYVAATRAREQLVISDFDQTLDGKTQQPLEWLATESMLETLATRTVTELKSTPVMHAADQEDWRLRHERASQHAAGQELLHTIIQNYRLSPTHLTTFLDVTQSGPRQFLVRHLLKFPESTSTSLVFGDSLHKTLEQAQLSFNKTGRLPSIATLVEYVSELFKQHNLRPVDYQKLVARGQQCLDAYINDRADGFTAANLAEQNFSNQKVILDQARLTGKIDRLWLDKATNQAVVTDFKTGKAFIKWQASADYDKHKLHKYQQQLGFYKILVEHSTNFANYRVGHGVLEFVEADKWGKLHSLRYDFEADEQQRLQKLIAVVWHKIMNLDLPDTSHYSPDFKGVEQFEQDLLEGKI